MHFEHYTGKRLTKLLGRKITVTEENGKKTTGTLDMVTSGAFSVLVRNRTGTRRRLGMSFPMSWKFNIQVHEAK